jgi:hypothetical protein
MRMLVDRDEPGEMRDGTILCADVYRPDSSDRYPVLLQRTPYDKNNPRITALLLDPMRAASAGYAVVVQDVRGCPLDKRHSPGDNSAREQTTVWFSALFLSLTNRIAARVSAVQRVRRHFQSEICCDTTRHPSPETVTYC